MCYQQTRLGENSWSQCHFKASFFSGHTLILVVFLVQNNFKYHTDFDQIIWIAFEIAPLIWLSNLDKTTKGSFFRFTYDIQSNQCDVLKRVVVVVGVHKDLHLQNIQPSQYDVFERGRGGGVRCGESEWGGKIKQVGMEGGCRQLNNIYHHCRDQPDFLISGILANCGCVHCHVEFNVRTSFHLKTAFLAKILPFGFCPENH